jgi:hypothetical protein
MPGKINTISDRFVAPIVDHDQFPKVVRQSLISECPDAPLEIIPAWVVSADNDGKHHSQRTHLLKNYLVGCGALLRDNLSRDGWRMNEKNIGARMHLVAEFHMNSARRNKNKIRISVIFVQCVQSPFSLKHVRPVPPPAVHPGLQSMQNTT